MWTCPELSSTLSNTPTLSAHQMVECNTKYEHTILNLQPILTELLKWDLSR